MVVKKGTGSPQSLFLVDNNNIQNILIKQVLVLYTRWFTKVSEIVLQWAELSQHAFFLLQALDQLNLSSSKLAKAVVE